MAPHAVVPLGGDLELELLDVGYTEGPPERYQVVVQHGSPGYDALGQPDSARHLLSLIASSAVIGEVRFSREPGAALPAGHATRLVDAEQSNTSVVFDDRAILKLFRRVECGVNPDIELNRVLARSGNRHVARLLGSFEMTDAGRQCPLGILTAYAADSTSGWDLARAGIRDGLAFTDEAYRLGAALASVHADLAAALGVSSAELPVERMGERLIAAASAVPQLGAFVGAIEQRYAAMAGTAINAQRVHGDVHLGQVLRTASTWLLIDFEGELDRPISQRRQPDSPLRDVAGMLRSFDYAAHQPSDDSRFAARAAEWVERTSAAFCDGYAARSGVDPRAQAEVLAVYELDKAVYEAAYEAGHRPGWLPIPLRAIARLTG